jgi:glyoxylase-like metal-dependent hydrolase (beta-lactamase superfamily II)
MAALAAGGALGGGEGVDEGFAPDRQIAEGDTIGGGWGEIEVIATPGHMANHLSFAWRGALFSGDMVMGWSTSLVSPPDGDMTAFMASLGRLAARADRIYYPGHGDPVTDPQSRVAELIAHRGPARHRFAPRCPVGTATAEALARAIYTDVAPALIPPRRATFWRISLICGPETRSPARAASPPDARFRCLLRWIGRDRGQFSRAPSGQQKTQLLCDRPVPA